jgi:cytidine deaminase
MKLTPESRQKLCQAAIDAAKLAYAPYSKFRVGAAVLCQEKIYIGTNVENASYGLSLCAERSAIAAAITGGEREIQAIAVACIDAANSQDMRSLVPCGACRQWLAELTPTAAIIICGAERTFFLEDLLPLSFRLS